VGADIEAVDEEGKTALHRTKELAEFVRYLPMKGSDLKVMDRNGHAALGIALLEARKPQHSLG